MGLITCKEATCNLPERAAVKITVPGTNDATFKTWKSMQGGTTAQFSRLLLERSLVKTSDMLRCKVGIEDVRVDGSGMVARVAHDCKVSDTDLDKVVNAFSSVIVDETGESPVAIKVQFSDTGASIDPSHEGAIAPVMKEIGECSVFIPEWSSPDSKARRDLIPTRHCIDKIQSALSSVFMTLDHEPELWAFATGKGEKVSISEDIIGSYLFYHLKGDHPMSVETCHELFDEKVIDGVDISYNTPKNRAPDIPTNIKDMLEQLYPGRGSKDFATRMDRYIEDPRLHVSRRGGQCEILTRSLKDSGEISNSWTWFGDGKNLVVFDPDKATEILTKRGYDVSVSPWIQDITRQPSVKIAGLNCSLRDYQVDPICRWTKRAGMVIDDGLNEGKLDWEEGTMQVTTPTGTIINEKIKRVVSYTPPMAAGGVIKAPTGAGKTIIGLVTMATQGAGVPDAMEVGG